LVKVGLAPHQVMIVGGIGCGSKLPDYTGANGFMTLHGRPLPVATGIKLANPSLKVITVHGDGDSMGLGMGHFIHTVRRNIGLVDLIQNNQIYGLTKGQYSPTSDLGFVTSTSPDGSIEVAANPVALALAAGGTFIARGFAGDVKGLSAIMSQALKHDGYALVDILQPCVTFNRRNTYDWYRERVYYVSEEGHDSNDPLAAWQKALEWGGRIPLGVIFQSSRPTYEEQVAGLKDGPLAARSLQLLSEAEMESLRAEFM
jgi:2-oxoglutarate ferredoxin oxidoreductase subunit beta